MAYIGIFWFITRRLARTLTAVFLLRQRIRSRNSASETTAANDYRHRAGGEALLVNEKISAGIMNSVTHREVVELLAR